MQLALYGEHSKWTRACLHVCQHALSKNLRMDLYRYLHILDCTLTPLIVYSDMS